MSSNEPQGGGLEELLTGLATGVMHAQRKLSQTSVVLQAGDAPITYQIPRVDFELKVALNVAAKGDEAGSSALSFRPGKGGRGGEPNSVIRGAFVATPVRGGKPPPVVKIKHERSSSRRYSIIVDVTEVSGEPQRGVEVQFNIDEELSLRLSQQALIGVPEQPIGAFDSATFEGASFAAPVLRGLQAGTKFWDGLVETDGEGSAVGVLEIDSEEPAELRIAAVVDVLGNTETIVFRVQ